MGKKIWLLRIPLCVIFIARINSMSDIHIDPRAGVIVKYVGDSINLTCSLSERNKSLVPVTLVGQASDSQMYGLNWIIPNNGHDRVFITEAKDMSVTINIKKLEESDNGKYTCLLLSKSPLFTHMAHVYLSVLPRGQVSLCSANSFFCKKFLCISRRYKCDGHPDCPDGVDESNEICGAYPCHGKLSCDDGRCLSPHLCCIEDTKSPPNCTIHASIQCCRQLIHPALLDQDLFYLSLQPKVKPSSTLIMGGMVAVTSLVVVGIIFVICLQLWKSVNLILAPTRSFHPWNILLSGNISSSNHSHVLQTGDLSCYEHHSNRVTHAELANSSTSCFHFDVVSQTTLPQLHSQNGSPPPSYNEVIQAVPPYSRLNNISETQSLSLISNQSSLGLVGPAFLNGMVFADTSRLSVSTQKDDVSPPSESAVNEHEYEIL